MDAAAVVTTVVEAGRQIADVISQLLIQAFRDPLYGLVYGGVLIAISKMGRVAFWTGVLVIGYSAVSLLARHLGVKILP